MRKLIGAISIVLGVFCLLLSVGFLVFNRWEADHAERVTGSLLEEVQLAIDENKENDTMLDPDDDFDTMQNDIHEDVIVPSEMQTVKVGGYDSIGVISFPVLELELPVLSDWSYVKLKKAPCHYYGSYYEKDFVIAAHNYKAHFGRLSELQAGDIIKFTDVNGMEHFYEVVLLETLPKEATEEMITSGFDLSLYTCTPGGANRITVRCISKDVD